MTLTCLRCGGSWTAKGVRLPLTCPKCRSPYWAKPRVNKLAEGKYYYHPKPKGD